MATTPDNQRVYTKADDWPEFIAEMHSGAILEVDQPLFDYFLEVLPPVAMPFIAGKKRYDFGFAEGEENIVGFWIVKLRWPRYFCRDTGILNRPWD